MTTSSSSPYTPPTATTHDYAASEWTQQNMLSDVLQQKGLIIGVGVVLVGIFLLRKRSAPEEKAARRLVRDWRHVDDPSDVRHLLGETYRRSCAPPCSPPWPRSNARSRTASANSSARSTTSSA